MISALENLCGPAKPLAIEPPDAREFAGLKRSALARLKNAKNEALALESGFDLAYNVAHALCFAALRWHGYIAPIIATACSECCRIRWNSGRRYGAYSPSAMSFITLPNTRA